MRTSRRLAITLGLVFLTLSGLSRPVRAQEYSYARVVRLSVVQGDVQITHSDEKGWGPALINMPLQQGYTIGTNNGRARVEFENGATADIAENTVLQFTDLALSDGGRITRLTLTQGTATFYANLQSTDTFVVLTPQISVTVPERAEVRLDISKESSAVRVHQGEVNIDTPSGTQTVAKGRTLIYSGNEEIRLERNSAADDWDRWVSNLENNQNSTSTQSQQYANAPFQYGLSDLFTLGYWSYYPGYGNCWQPYGVGIG
ncbi:MAG: FecR domain-containing protein, partial [Candidatus Acidiferrales bacterium]